MRAHLCLKSSTPSSFTNPNSCTFFPSLLSLLLLLLSIGFRSFLPAICILHSLVLYGCTIDEKRRRRVLRSIRTIAFPMAVFRCHTIDSLLLLIRPLPFLPRPWLSLDWLVLSYCIVGRDGAVPGVLFGPYDCLWWSTVFSIANVVDDDVVAASLCPPRQGSVAFLVRNQRKNKDWTMGFVWRWLLVRLRQTTTTTTTTTTKLQSTMSHCTHPLSFLFAPLALLCILFFRQFTKRFQKCSHFSLSASLAWASALSQCLPLAPLGGRQRHARRLWFCCAAPHGVVFFECIP